MKTAVVAKKIALASHGAAIGGKVLTKVAAKKAAAANHIKAWGASLKGKVKGVLTKVHTERTVQTREQVAPAAPAILDTQYVLNTPLTGPRYGRLQLTTGTGPAITTTN